MVAHRPGGRLRVPCSNRGDDRIVFRERAGHVIAHLELHATVWLQHRMNREASCVRKALCVAW